MKMMDRQQETAALLYKLASEPWEFEQIHRLNYATFVEEIPQHGPNDDRALVDRFHDQNTYIVCLSGRELMGMVCVREQRPFSLEQKVADLWSYLPPAENVCELRLLATKAEHRKGRIFAGLTKALSAYCLERGHDLAIISATTRQLKLYRHMGFVPFGPLIGTAEAPYQPMYLTQDVFHGTLLRLAPLDLGDEPHRRLNFLPGPVDVSQAVRNALTAPPASHRSSGFHDEFESTRNLVCEQVGARFVQMLAGSGTMANDAVAAQLQRMGGRGLVLSNGEFGDRLIEAARRFGLAFDVLRRDWGEPMAPVAIAAALDAKPRPAWVWMTHCETSTGILNPLGRAAELCKQHGVRLCADCISSFGTLPLDLSALHLATATSGKGIGSIAGLAMVFHNEPIAPASDLPPHLDLGLYAENGGVPFTISSNLVCALNVAIEQTDVTDREGRCRPLAASIREAARAAGLRVIAPDAHASPAVTTLELPATIDSGLLGTALAGAGCLVGHESPYLRQRNWIQISLMSEHSPESVDRLLRLLGTMTQRGGL
jgi:aspartate aminotransferase-like enzyme